MKSRITIEVDFENGNKPIIQILKANSSDVRDRLISAFTEQLGGSSWCQIKWALNKKDDDGAYIHIAPITPSELKTQGKIMIEQAELSEKF